LQAALTLLSAVGATRLAIVNALSLAFIVLSVAASLTSGDTRFTLLKESAFTGLTGLIFLGSLVIGRPVMFAVGRRFAAHGDPRVWRRETPIGST
jgi:hypothetical protein